MKKIFQISLIIASVFALSSCNKEYEDITSDRGFIGVFVRNQAGSISYFSEIDNTVTADIYNVVNGANLGESPIAFSISGQKGFLLKGDVNDQKIETVDSQTLKSGGELGNFSNLTDLKAVSDTFVVVTQSVSGSENSGSLMFLDSKNLGNNLATISLGKNPTRIAYSRGKKLYVANTGGGAYPDSTVMVIDIDSKTVIDTVVLEQKVDDLNTLRLTRPIDLVQDAYQNVWVLCAGEGVKGAGLAKINYGTHKVTVFQFENGYKGKGRGGLCSFGGTIYFVNDGIYALDVNDTMLPTKKFLTEADERNNPETFYRNEIFNVIGVSSNTGKFFCAKDGVDGAEGKINIFDRYGLIMDTTITVGKMPRELLFVR